MFKRQHHVYQAPEGGDGSAGEGAAGDGAAAAGAAEAAGAGAAAAGADGGAAAAGSGASTNVLAELGKDGGDGGGAAAGGEASAWSTKVPEQFHVKKADGSLDMEATLLKQSQSYGELHKRMVDNGAPPKDAAEYKVTVPDLYAGKWDPDKDESVAEFRKTALGLGLSQKQFDGVVAAYLDRIPGMIEQTQEQQAEACRAELGKVWKTPAEMKTNGRAAIRAVESILGADAQMAIAHSGNNPWFMRLAAGIGAEMAEDASPGQGEDGSAQFRGMTRDQLMAHPAYSDAKHVDHQRVSALVRSSYENQYGTAEA